MNFISTFDELNKLYEELEAPVVEKEEVTENFDNESGSKAWNNTVIGYYTQAAKELGLADFDMKAVNIGGGKQKAVITAKKDGKQISTEADYIETVNIKTVEDAKECLEYYFGDLSESVEPVEPVEEPLTEAAEEEVEIVEDEPRQLICECDKCGALVIKDEADIIIDEESDLVNVEDKCQFCEEAKGFKIIGVVAPYEAADEEALIDDKVIDEPEIPADEAPIDESLTEASNKNKMRVADVEYEDDDGEDVHVLVFADDLAEDDLTDLLYDRGMTSVEVNRIFEDSIDPFSVNKLGRIKPGDVVRVLD